MDELDLVVHEDWQDWNRRFNEAFPPPPPEPAKDPGPCGECGDLPESFYVEEYAYPIAYSRTCWHPDG